MDASNCHCLAPYTNELMPHLILEVSDNVVCIGRNSMLRAVNRAVLDSGLFEESDIKSRAQLVTTYEIGCNEVRRGFLHASIEILSGRTDKQKRDLAQRVLAAILGGIDVSASGDVQVSVSVRELDKSTYSKAHLRAGG